MKTQKKELATTKNSKKHWQIGIISFLAVATLSSVLLFGYNRNNHSVSSTKPSVVLVKNSSAEKSNKKTSSPKKQDTSSKKKLEQPSTPKPETPEQKLKDQYDALEKKLTEVQITAKDKEIEDAKKRTSHN